MKITGKAKEDFNVYLVSNSSDIFKCKLFGDDQDVYDEFYNLPNVCQSSIIIEFFGTKKYVGENLFMFIFEKSFAIKASFMTFDDITDQAIEICNKLYNNEWLKQ